VPGILRLGIPPLRITNGPAGVGPGGAGAQSRAAALPAPIASAATWDPARATEYGKLASEEMKAFGPDLFETLVVNILRVPPSGHASRGLGKDPWLTSRIAVVEIKGIQSTGVEAKPFAKNVANSFRSAVA